MPEILGLLEEARSSPFPDEVHRSMMRMLTEAEADSEQRSPVPLNRDQRRLVTSRTRDGYRRIEGPAGSGKTAVLAARAAELTAMGRRPLVISFNHTLWHWIRDLAVRHRSAHGSISVNRIRFCTFHDWCAQVCTEAGLGRDLKRVLSDADAYPLAKVQDLVAVALAAGVSPPEDDRTPTGYDDLLVDEAQDLDARSWDLLRRGVLEAANPGERLVAFDAEQNLYKQDLAWAQEAGDSRLATAGFRGPPLRLSFSYRLPPQLIPALNDFRANVLGHTAARALEAGSTHTAGQLAFGCHLSWKQVSQPVFAAELAEAARRAPDEMSLSPADVRTLQSAGHKVKHVFGENHESRRHRRKAFWKGQAYLASTIHSFKGYEQRGVVLGIEAAEDEADHDGLVAVYIGLTRVKAMADGSAALTVICADERLRSFGQRWFEPG